VLGRNSIALDAEALLRNTAMVGNAAGAVTQADTKEKRGDGVCAASPSPYFQSLNISSSACCRAAFVAFSIMAVICASSQSYCFFSRFLRSSSLLISFSPPLESAHSMDRRIPLQRCVPHNPE